MRGGKGGVEGTLSAGILNAGLDYLKGRKGGEALQKELGERKVVSKQGELNLRGEV